MADETLRKVTCDGANYAVSDLTQTTRNTVDTLGFVEASPHKLQDALVASQIEHVAYACALNSNLDQQGQLASA